MKSLTNETQDILRIKFDEFLAKNPGLSLRAFAKKIALSPSTVSEVLSGKRRLSRDNALKVAKNLMFTPEEEEAFVAQSLGLLVRDSKFRKVQSAQKEMRILNRKQYDVISEWMHFALLSLMKTHGFTCNHEFMAQRLGITKAKLLMTIKNLMDLGLIKVNANGEYERTKENLSTTDNILDLSIQKAHLSDLEMIKDKMSIDITKRDFTALTFPVDLALMDKAREILRRAQDEIDELMQREGKCQEVYRLSCYFYPLTEINKTQLNELGDNL